MGEVWLARRAAVGGVSKPVAIKLVPLDPSLPAHERAFVDEARLSTLLSHSNIVQVFDVGTAGPHGYMVMEAIDGIDLARLSKTLLGSGVAIPPRVAAYVVAQMLRGLTYAHALELDGAALRIVHRDISPQNVLLSVSGEVKLVDFGIARSSLDASTGINLKGKLRYMAAEQFAGAPVDARADLYAVGAVLHELLAGRPLREGSTPGELYGELAAPTVPPVATGAPVELDRVRQRLLDPDPARRFATAGEALSALMESPLYVDASAELAALCRDVTGVAGPRAALGSRPHAHAEPSSPALTGSATWTGHGTAATATAITARGDSSGVAAPIPEAHGATPRASGSSWRVVVAVALTVTGLAVLAAAAITARSQSREEPAAQVDPDPPDPSASPPSAPPAQLLDRRQAEAPVPEAEAPVPEAEAPVPEAEAPVPEAAPDELTWTSGFCLVGGEHAFASPV